jgi:hypothetical protein
MVGGWSAAQVVKYLPSKCKALGSMLNTAKKEKNIYICIHLYNIYVYIHTYEKQLQLD